MKDDRIFKDGTKKILSLTRTKIRLAEEASTVECIPSPPPLVKRILGKEIRTVSEVKALREDLASGTDYLNPESMAKTVVCCMDVIEGVKYKYEPEKYMCNLDVRALDEKDGVNVLIMTEELPEGLSLYVGDNPPEGAVFVSGVPTSLAAIVEYFFSSQRFSEAGRLKNVNCFLGRKTLINNAIYRSLGVYGAKLG